MKETGQRIYIRGAIKEVLFTVGRELLFLNKIKRLTAQNDIDKEGRGGSHEGPYDMCMYANLYKYHNKSMMLQRLRLSAGSGRWV